MDSLVGISHTGSMSYTGGMHHFSIIAAATLGYALHKPNVCTPESLFPLLRPNGAVAKLRRKVFQFFYPSPMISIVIEESWPSCSVFSHMDISKMLKASFKKTGNTCVEFLVHIEHTLMVYVNLQPYPVVRLYSWCSLVMQRPPNLEKFELSQ